MQIVFILIFYFSTSHLKMFLTYSYFFINISPVVLKVFSYKKSVFPWFYSHPWCFITLNKKQLSLSLQFGHSRNSNTVIFDLCLTKPLWIPLLQNTSTTSIYSEYNIKPFKTFSKIAPRNFIQKWIIEW